jgi:copper(I)-binding protein
MARFTTLAAAGMFSIASAMSAQACEAHAQAARQAKIILAQHAHGQAAPAKATPVAIKAGDIVVTAPWTRATPGGAKVAGGYMRLTNTGKEADRLIGGSLPQAGRFEVHEMATVNNVMTMRQLDKGLEIRPGETVELKPGGFHVMFMDLKGGLKQGQPVKGTLVFERGGKVEIEYSVAPIGAQSPGGGHSHH